jgi:hypothetical protein
MDASAILQLNRRLMPERQKGNPSPNGFSVSVIPSFGRLGVGGLSGTYYWDPGSNDSPSFTLTGVAGSGVDNNSAGYPLLGLLGRLGLRAGPVFLHNGMTSKDTLGLGMTANQSTMIPSVTMNSTMPRDRWGLPRVTSIEGGVSSNIGTYRAGTYTLSGQQIGNTLITPAMGPEDELPPLTRTLQSSVGTVGQNSEPPVRFLSSRYQNPVGSGMAGWTSSVDGIDPQRPAQLAPLQQPTQPAPSPQEPGGLLGLLLDHLRNN